MSGSDRRSERSAESMGDLEEDRAGECDEPAGRLRPPAGSNTLSQGRLRARKRNPPFSRI